MGAGFPHAAAGSPEPLRPQPGSATMLVCMSFVYACACIPADMDAGAEADADIPFSGRARRTEAQVRVTRGGAHQWWAVGVGVGADVGSWDPTLTPRDGPPVASATGS